MTGPTEELETALFGVRQALRHLEHALETSKKFPLTYEELTSIHSSIGHGVVILREVDDPDKELYYFHTLKQSRSLWERRARAAGWDPDVHGWCWKADLGDDD